MCENAGVSGDVDEIVLIRKHPPAHTCFLCNVIKGVAHFTNAICERCLHTRKWWQRHVSEMIVALKLQIHLRVLQGSHSLQVWNLFS